MFSHKTIKTVFGTGLLLLEALVLMLSLSAIAPRTAFAYVDPSVMTYTIQAIAGVAVALSAVAGVAMRRTRKWLFGVLNIDENARKNVEPDVHRMSELGNSQADQDHIKASADFVTKITASNKPGQPGEQAPLRMRLICAFIVALFVSATYFLIAPFELVAGNVDSLEVKLDAVAPIAIGLTAMITLALTGVLLLFRRKGFWYALAAVFAVGAAGWVQAMFLNVGLPPADGTTIVWTDHDRMALISTVVWLIIIVGSLLLVRYKELVSQKLLPALACALILVQGVGAASIVLDSQNSADDLGVYSTIPTEDGLFEVSSKSNVIVFCLDTVDTKDLLRLEQEYPDMLSGLTGFTWYTDASGSMIPTRYAVPFLMTGELPREDEKWSTYLHERYNRSNFLSDINAAGYTTGIYSDTLRLGNLTDAEAREWVAEKTINFHQTNLNNPAAERINVKGTVIAIVQTSFYRDFPWILKPRFWFTTEWMNYHMVKQEDTAPEDTTYVIDDALYYKKLEKYGLTVNDRDAEGAFRFIHMMGSHKPYNMDETATRVADGNATVDQQTRGTFLIVSDYLDKLRELGLYDDAVIIITADHGNLQLVGELEQTSLPIVMVKPAQSHEEASAPLKKDDTPIIHGDLVPTIIDAVGGDPSQYSGCSLIGDEPIVHDSRTYLATRESDDRKYDDWIIEYEITGNSLDFSNWKKTGRTWNARE